MKYSDVNTQDSGNMIATITQAPEAVVTNGSWQLLLHRVLDADRATLLAGAGISSSAPSNLPMANQFLGTLFQRWAAHDSRFSDVLALLGARTNGAPWRMLPFEDWMELIQSFFDPRLELLKVFGACRYPNRYHIWLAQVMSRGVDILTTNFDMLLEQALETTGTSYAWYCDDREHVCRHCDAALPKALPKLVKLHGSWERPDGTDARLSIRATLRAIASRRLDGLFGSIFPPLLQSRSLIVMGYSGGDYIDVMEGIRGNCDRAVVWIVHAEAQPKVYTRAELPGLLETQGELAHVCDLLLSCGSQDNLLIRGRTADILDSITSHLHVSSPELGSDQNFEVDLNEYCDQWWNAFDQSWWGNASHFLAEACRRGGNFVDALELYGCLVENLVKLKAPEGFVADVKGNMGVTYADLGDHGGAIRLHELALEGHRHAEDDIAAARDLGNLARSLVELDRQPEAVLHLQDAYSVFQGYGVDEDSAIVAYNLAACHQDMGDMTLAEDWSSRAEQLAKPLGLILLEMGSRQRTAKIRAFSSESDKGVRADDTSKEGAEKRESKEGISVDCFLARPGTNETSRILQTSRNTRDPIQWMIVPGQYELDGEDAIMKWFDDKAQQWVSPGTIINGGVDALLSKRWVGPKLTYSVIESSQRPFPPDEDEASRCALDALVGSGLVSVELIKNCKVISTIRKNVVGQREFIFETAGPRV